MVVDASAVIAIPRQESIGARVAATLRSGTVLLMSSVTLTEVFLIGLKNGVTLSDAVALIEGMKIEIVPVYEALSVASAEVRHRYPIRFSDAVVYALAKAHDLPVLTLDAEFRKTDIALVSL